MGNKPDVRFGPVPHFALGPITDVSDPTSPSGDSLVFGMNDVDGWFDVRGLDIRDIGVASPSCRVRVSGSVMMTAHTAKRHRVVSNSMRKSLRFGRDRSRYGIFVNGIYAFSGQDPVSAPSSFQALTVFWPTRGR